jgi:hypothetical protein
MFATSSPWKSLKKMLCQQAGVLPETAFAKAGPVGDDGPALAPWRSNASILAWLEAL